MSEVLDDDYEQLVKQRNQKGQSLLTSAASLDFFKAIQVIVNDCKQKIEIDNDESRKQLLIDWLSQPDDDEKGLTAIHYAARSGIYK